MRKIELEEQKKMQLDMLIDIDAFCRENNLRYFLHCGSLLGAVRHKGYIPWDDDIDIAMPRKDYEVFISTYNQKKTNPDYEVICYKINPEFYLPFGKLINNKTIMHEPVADTDLELGIYVDIFPLDNMGSTREEAQAFYEETTKLRKKLIVKNWKIIKERAWYKNIIIYFAKLFSNTRSRYNLIKKLDETCRRFEENDVNGYVGIACAANYGEREIMKGEWYSDYVLLPFEGLEFRAPIGYEGNLSNFYGDFMKLPPVEKQVSHHVNDAWYKD